jgi:hypothetical protein
MSGREETVEHDAALHAWESFYVIVGSSAAALTGLQFVVIALVSEFRRRSSELQIGAFATPTVVHFTAVLMLSATLSAPWPTMQAVAVIAGIAGTAGVVYQVIVIVRARRQSGYAMVFEDWLWHTALPLVAYGALFVSAPILWRAPGVPLFVIAGVTLLLLAIGIHNAWDTVTFLFLEESAKREQEGKGE